MKSAQRRLFLVGPTGSGKSELAVEVAARCRAEIVNADPFQAYKGLARLTAQPNPPMLLRVPHHLVGTIDPGEEISAGKFAALAEATFEEVAARGKNALIVSGSGLYVRALSEGLSELPPGDARLRARFEHFSLGELNSWLRLLDPATAETVDQQNRRRVTRAVEICILSGEPASRLRPQRRALQEARGKAARGVFVFRDRDDLYQRINFRVEEMFAAGVVEEVRALGRAGSSAQKTLGLSAISQLLRGEIAVPDCIARIQQETRGYAKRQLTWFRGQTSFEPLNLSQRSTAEAVEWIVEKARLCFSND